jgi:hypothetical protein
MENEAVSALRALASNGGHQSTIGRIRNLFEEIENTKKAGVSLEKIVEALNAQGFDMTLATFKMMLYRIRKETGDVGSMAMRKRIHDSTRRQAIPVASPQNVTAKEADSNGESDEFAGLTLRQRADKIADKFMRPEVYDPFLKRLLEKGDGKTGAEKIPQPKRPGGT